MPLPTKTERNARIMELREEGLSGTDIMFKLLEEGFERISAARVYKIINRELGEKTGDDTSNQ